MTEPQKLQQSEMEKQERALQEQLKVLQSAQRELRQNIHQHRLKTEPTVACECCQKPMLVLSVAYWLDEEKGLCDRCADDNLYDYIPYPYKCKDCQRGLKRPHEESENKCISCFQKHQKPSLKVHDGDWLD